MRQGPIAVAIVAISLLSGFARAADVDSEAIGGRLEAAGGDVILSICPSSLIDGSASRQSSSIDCEDDREACISSCLDGKNGQACFGLGLLLQEDGESRQAQIAFALGCERGHVSACTNRAAGILNRSAGEAFGDQAEPEHCTFATFSETCVRQDAWGCTMVGVAYHFGVGVAVDVAKAKTFYERSCAIDADFEACGYARGALAKLLAQ